jgi:hypothetical protein
MYKVRTDISEEKRKQLSEATAAIVPNGFSGYVTVQLVGGKTRTIFTEREDDR